nr:putative protein kinase [Dunaliella parva]
MEANEPKSAAHQQNKTGRGGTSGRAGTSIPPTDPKGPAFDGPSSHTRSRGPQGPSKKHKPSNGECVLKISGKLQQGAGSALLLGSMDDMPVVFKVVDANMPELIPDLEHEAAIYGRLQHLQGTYIPVLREVGFHFHNSMFTVIIDFIGDAESLHDFVATGKPLPQSLAKEAEKGLAAIHRAGVLHGDLHASNILLKPPSVYFIDFEGSRLSPTASEKQAEMQQLRNIRGAPRSSDASDRDVLSRDIHSPY